MLERQDLAIAECRVVAEGEIDETTSAPISTAWITRLTRLVAPPARI
jgi:hypothetical protein